MCDPTLYTLKCPLLLKSSHTACLPRVSRLTNSSHLFSNRARVLQSFELLVLFLKIYQLPGHRRRYICPPHRPSEQIRLFSFGEFFPWCRSAPLASYMAKAPDVKSNTVEPFTLQTKSFATPWGILFPRSPPQSFINHCYFPLHGWTQNSLLIRPCAA